MWSMSGVINVLFHTRCDQCLVWSMSFFTHSVINVWCDQCPVWWMSGVINVWCDQCPISHTVWSMSGVINVRCGQCPFLHTVWSMSCVINVCVINVVQSCMCMCMMCMCIHLAAESKPAAETLYARALLSGFSADALLAHEWAAFMGWRYIAEIK